MEIIFYRILHLELNVDLKVFKEPKLDLIQQLHDMREKGATPEEFGLAIQLIQKLQCK